jgi:hypothetical protein
MFEYRSYNLPCPRLPEALKAGKKKGQSLVRFALFA